MNTKAQRLWDLGYLWQMTRADAGKLADTDLEFISAVTRLQEWFYDTYQEFGQMHYARAVNVDGVAGKATQSMLDPAHRICGLPDIPPPADVDLSEVEDEHFRNALQSMQRLAGGVERGQAGGWRKGCYPDKHDGYAVKIHFNVDSFKHAVWKDSWPEIQAAIIRDYAEYGLLLVPSDYAGANIRFYHRELSGGTIGLAQLPGNNASCSLAIWCTVDTDYGRDNKYARYRVSEHEIGHSVDLEHTNGGLMNPYIILVNDYVGFKNDPSERALKAYYGGVPIRPKDPDKPKGDTVLATVNVKDVDEITIVAKGGGGGGWSW